MNSCKHTSLDQMMLHKYINEQIQQKTNIFFFWVVVVVVLQSIRWVITL